MRRKQIAGLILACVLTILTVKSNLTTVAAEPENWYSETVDTTVYVGRYNSLALDADGYPHISYYDSHPSFEDLKYAFQNSSGWFTETAVSGGNVGKYNSLALDANGNAHVSYRNETPGEEDLEYAFRDASGWSSETVDSGGVGVAVGAHTSLVLDTAGYPHISYANSSGGDSDLRYAFQNSTGWYPETVDSADQVGGYTSLALDATGYPHISYTDAYNDELKYAFQNSTGWYPEAIGPIGPSGGFTSLALDAADYAHISYYNSASGYLMYAYQNSTGWYTEAVNTEYGTHTSLALDADGFAHISYHGSSSTVKYARKTSNGWYIETVGTEAAYYTSLALDAYGNGHISYYDSTNLDLKYARSKNAVLTFPQFLIVDEFFALENITYIYRVLERYTQQPISDANVTVTFDGAQYQASDEGNGYYEVVLPYSSDPEVCEVTITKAGLMTATFTYAVYVDPPAVEKSIVSEFGGLLVIIFVASLALVVPLVIRYARRHNARKR